MCLIPTKWPNMEENLISRCSSNVQTVLVRFLCRKCCKAAGRCSYLASRRSQESSGYATRLFIGFPLSAKDRQYRERERETDRWRGRQRAERLELDNPAVGVKTYHDSAQGEMGQENDGKSNLHPPVWAQYTNQWPWLLEKISNA